VDGGAQPSYTLKMAVRAEPAALVTEPSRPAAALSGPALLGVLIAVAATVVASRLAGAGEVPRLEEFTLVFSSIVVEALPFILAGALVSSLIAVLVSDRVFARVGRLPTAVQVPGAMLCGLAFPVCECGSVPVARRLISRGVTPAAGIAFMLAAPVVNPVVLASTWVAYSGSGLALEMTAARAAVGFAVAAAAGLALRRVAAPRLSSAPPHSHEYSGGRLRAVADHLGSDFLFMGKFLVLGAAVSALIQTFVSRDLLEGLGGLPILGSLALMALAVLLSLCSEADAFVAVSFSSFGAGSQLAFLALGPVFDLKLAALYAATFSRRFVPLLLLVAVPIILVAAILFEALVT
jgi:uncharacterized membrane protein YraQ (UPF0718 family)